MRWYLPVVPGICSGLGSLFGGCGLGASIEALEATTGRRVVWATAQYLSFARPPDVLDLDVIVAAEGRATTQARVVAHVGSTEILTVNAALGDRSFDESGQWVTRPDVAGPDDCPPRELRFDPGETMSSRLEQRMALQAPDQGRVAVWTRVPDVLETSAAALAVLGDFVPMGIGLTVGVNVTSNSLDNTLRMGSLVPTEWVLIDVRVDLIARGFGHGVAYLWADDGTLLAAASQSALIRQLPD